MPTEGTAVDPNAPVELTAEQAQIAWNEVAAERADPLTPVAQAEPTAEPAAPAEIAPKDPVLERLEAQDALIKKLSQDLKMASGRVSKIQGELDAGRAAAKAVKDAPTADQQAAAAIDPAKWTALKEEFPEWTDAMDSRISERLAAATKNLQPAASGQPVDVDEVIRKREIQRVLRKHKDFEDVRRSEDFATWRATQPPEVNALGASELAEDAIEMMDLFKASKVAPAEAKPEIEADALQAARAQRLRAAAGPAPRQTQATKTGGELTPQEIWAQEAAERAKRKAA